MAFGDRHHSQLALEHVDTALALFTPDSPPEFVAAQLDAARAHLGLGDLDAATARIVSVLDLPVELRTTPIVERVGKAANELRARSFREVVERWVLGLRPASLASSSAALAEREAPVFSTSCNLAFNSPRPAVAVRISAPMGAAVAGDAVPNAPITAAAVSANAAVARRITHLFLVLSSDHSIVRMPGIRRSEDWHRSAI